MLVIQDGIDDIRLSRQQNGGPTDHFTTGMSANEWRYRHSYGTGGSRYRRRLQGCGSSSASGRGGCARGRSWKPQAA